MSTMPSGLKEVLQKKYQNLYETCSEVFRFIFAQEEGEQHSYFTSFLRDAASVDLPIENPEEFLSKEVLTHITDDIGSLCTRILENLVKENISEEDFYKKLWEKLCDNTLLPDDDAKTAFLMCLWLDPRLPYFHLETGLRMDDEYFKTAVDKIQPQLSKAFFILTVPFEQKTQRASLLVALADELEGDERIVFWAAVISQLLKIGYRRQTEQTEKEVKDME